MILIQVFTKKFTFIIFFSLLVCIAIYIVSIKRTKGFCYSKIRSSHPYESRWDFGAPSQSQEALLEKIATQPFSFLGSGKECYAFVSADKNIVVKFFKQNRLKTQQTLSRFPFFKKAQRYQASKLSSFKRQTLFQNCQTAYEQFPEETGILYLHLTKSKNLKKTLHITLDKSKPLALNLDDMEFIVQKKANLIFDELSAFPEKGKEIISSIVHFIISLKNRGLGDHDINCRKNLGIINETPIQIDIGEIYPLTSKTSIRQELTVATLDLKDFLEKNYPHLAYHLQKEIEALP